MTIITPAFKAPSAQELEVMFNKSTWVVVNNCGCPMCQDVIKVLSVEGDVVEAPPTHILPERKQSWANALRSGMWTQVHGEWGTGSHRCAVSVLLALVGVPLIHRMDTYAARKLAEWLGVTVQELNDISARVIRWNDTDRLSFDEIADRIEREY
jgi:hypothetical protein